MSRFAAALSALALGASAVGAGPMAASVNETAILDAGLPRKLSEFGFFSGAGTARPHPALIGYSLRTPLFSDYADKQRFIYIPAGARASVYGDGKVSFPVGSALIKTFGYGEGAAFRPIETRVLLRRASGWEALPYVWNDDLTDAELKVAGMRVPAVVTRPTGERVTISYAVPNKNQCKECHSSKGALVPIGPRYRNMALAPEADRSLRERTSWPRNLVESDGPIWNDPASGSLDARARAYLAINCGHCHNPDGSASNSGLFLDDQQPHDPVATGLYKRPVAAGRGSGGHDFAILPGDPARSIMIHRMASTEPGVAMPELGRAMVHEEGVALIRAWISSLPVSDSSG